MTKTVNMLAILELLFSEASLKYYFTIDVMQVLFDNYRTLLWFNFQIDFRF